jgi:hypothetical protein
MKANPKSTDIRDVEKQFKRWRRSRKSREPIPDHLWEAAVGLTGEMSPHAVARRLHLNPTALKQRIGTLSSRKSQRGKGAASFIEVPTRFWESASQGEKSRCVVKLRRADGAEMALIFHDDREGEIGSLVRGFLGGGA